MDLHVQLTQLSALVGTWHGHGAGEYPTIDSFEYEEELTFEHVGKPFLAYRQRTWSLTGAPMHTEAGFLRAPGDDAIELTLAQPTGQAELAQGIITTDPTGFQVELRSQVLNSASAKVVEETRRSLRLVDDELTVEFAMAAVGHPLTHHLRSTLHRR